MGPSKFHQWARRTLSIRRDVLLRRRRANMRDQQELLETPEPDWEDLAANRTTAALLGALSQREYFELTKIVAAIARLDSGAYGACAVCGSSIGEARLRAVPEAERCTACTETVRVPMMGTLLT